MQERPIDVFFYGLFMDQQLLEAKGVHPTDIRLAVVSGFVLRIGARAALVPTPASQVHGLLMRLSHADIEKLYAEPSVRAYRPEPVLAVTAPNGTAVAALCYNLPEPPSPVERNAEYASKLRSLAERVGLPTDYVESIQ
jgi:Gamma-glutamyl cyclotransferase, AIG2-like